MFEYNVLNKTIANSPLARGRGARPPLLRAAARTLIVREDGNRAGELQEDLARHLGGTNVFFFKFKLKSVLNKLGLFLIDIFI